LTTTGAIWKRVFHRQIAAEPTSYTKKNNTNRWVG
jgi:hypothetical protein